MEEKKEETKFCRLCAKTKPMADFCDIALAQNPEGTRRIVYKGCKMCDVVIHNALLIIKETMDRERVRIKEENEKKVALAAPRIIIPGTKEFKM
jgi:hypothetical protein